MNTRIFLLSIFIICFCFYACSSKKGFQDNIELVKDCMFDTQGRQTVEKIENVIATVSIENELVFLTVGEDRYITCSLPITLREKEIMISGNVLETFPTERLMATPLQVIKAFRK